MVEKQSGHHIKILRTNRGGEYISEEFLRFCKDNGIKKQFTTRYTPQQNGIAKRKNRTIQEMARSMIKAKGLSNEYWAEAVGTAIYLLNRSPTKSVRDKSPQEAWSNEKPNVEHLRVFGCVAYAHVPKQKRTKWDDRGEKCIFIGYSDQSKAYKLYNPITKEMIISRDIEFIENATWNDNKQLQESTTVGVPIFENESTCETSSLAPSFSPISQRNDSSSSSTHHGAQNIAHGTPSHSNSREGNA
eukprot:Gb_35302 [translate_table: standard]